MNPAAFDAIATLIRSRGPSRDGARLVLVDGLSRKDAAHRLGIAGTTISKAIRRIRDAEAIILAAYCPTTPTAPLDR